MKSLIFGVVALVCLQAIYADRNCDSSNGFSECTGKSKQCRSKLSTLRKNAKAFFGKFETAHDEAHEYYLQIQKICDALNQAIAYYSSLSDDLNTLRCELGTFVDTFGEQRTAAMQHIEKLSSECDSLLDIAIAFMNSNDLTCNESSDRVGCESELNRLRCKLSRFFTTLSEQHTNAKEYLRRLKISCGLLDQETNNFASSNDLTCAADGYPSTEPERSDLVANINGFFAVFKKDHDIAHDVLELIRQLCQALLDSLREWNTSCRKY